MIIAADSTGMASRMRMAVMNRAQVTRGSRNQLIPGARLLMDRMNIDTVDRIRLAGAFGSRIDVKYAMVLGLIPDCDLAQVSSANNAAGTGARIALLSKASRGEIEQRVDDIEKVETAIDERFQDHFVEAMAIPHATRPFPNLSKVVSLPDTAACLATSRNARRRVPAD